MTTYGTSSRAVDTWERMWRIFLLKFARVDFDSGTKGWGNQWDDRVGGQQFDTDNYNIIIEVESY